MAEGQKKGRLIDPEFRRIRFLQFVNDKLAGLTDKEIGAKHNLTKRTVERTLSWGKRAGIIADAEDSLLKDLFPAAQAVLMDALADGDVTVAMKIYDKVVKGRDAKVGTHSVVDEDELSKFMAERRKRQEQIEATIDGELAEGPAFAGLLTGEQHLSEGSGAEDGGQSPADPTFPLSLRSEEHRSEPATPFTETTLAPDGEVGEDLALDSRDVPTKI